MAHIPDQLIKINKNIQEAEAILVDLKKRTKTENVAEQIEHFESMLNKLNGLKESYLQLSAQYEANSDMKNSLTSVASVLQKNSQGVSSYDTVNGVSSSNANSVFNIRNALSSVDQLEQLKQERDRLKKELQNQQSSSYASQLTNILEVDVTNNTVPFTTPNNFSDLVSDLQNFTGLDLSFYISILDHHIDIGSKMADMVDGLSLSDNLEQGISLLKEVIQRLIELRERFQSVQSARENIESQNCLDEEILQREMDTFNSISEDLKINFATGVKCFKSAMDIIQSYLDPSAQIDGDRVVGIEGFSDFKSNQNDSDLNGAMMICNEQQQIPISSSKNNNNNSESASEDNNNPSNEENNDGGDEDSDDDDSCREKDQDESMEMGASTAVVDSINEHHIDQEAMHHLRLQTEFEQKEILRLLEEKRIMQNKLADLKRAKEIAKSQALSLAQSGTAFGDFSHFLRSSQCNDLEDNDDNEAINNLQRPDSLALRTGTMVSEMGSLLKMLSEIKTDVSCDDSYQKSPRKSNSNTAILINDSNNLPQLRMPYNSNSLTTYSGQGNIDLNEKAEELKQNQSQIQKLQEMLDHIKSDSLTLSEAINQDSNDDYHSDHDNEREISNNGRPGKGRDSVTFQEPVATFIANEELYENMREVRMRREELRDRSARNSNSDPRSQSGRVIDSGNAPGAPPDAPTRMPVTSHETASQDRTTAATWGSSSAGGDDYDNHSGDNQLNSENLRIRSEGGAARVSPLTNTTTTDERNRVAPVGQSSTFRSKMRDSSYIKNVIDNDFSNLKVQIENIASLCRNMAVEQNRLAHDIADLKSGPSPRLTNVGPDLVINSSGVTNGAKHIHGSSSLLTDDNLINWGNTSSNSIVNCGGPPPMMTNMNSMNRNGSSLAAYQDPSLNFTTHARLPPNHIDANWEEASITSSNVINNHQKQMSLYYYPPPPPPPSQFSYHNMMNQQALLLQNHNMFMKLQMSLMASQLEQQRLCNIALQQHSSVYPQSSGWPVRGLNPQYYPPPGPLVPSHVSMLAPPSIESAMSSMQPNFSDNLDCGMYSMMYPSETSSTRDVSTTIANPNIVPSNTSNGNPWKNNFSNNRNIHRN